MTGAATRRRFQRLRMGGVPRAALKAMTRGGLGAGLGIGLLAWLAQTTGEMLLVAPFGATVCLIFGAPESPFAQPRNTIFGHLIGALCGLAALALIGTGPLALGVGVATAVGLMIGLGVVHPPAAANPIVIILTKATPAFLAMPLAPGIALLMALALAYNRLTGARYPKSWL